MIRVSRGTVVMTGAPYSETLALEAVLLGSTPSPGHLDMSLLHFSPHFCTVHFNKGRYVYKIFKKTYKKTSSIP